MMDRIRQRAQSLLEKLHGKYGIEPKHPIHLVLAAAVCRKEGDDPGLQDHWYLVDTHGQKFRLPKTMLFLGREECDVVVASQSVDKRHAVLTFDLYLNRFKVKDLSTTNGTYVNNSRIPEQEYVTLNHMDSVRLGHDAMMYHVEQGSQITGQGGQLPDPSFVPAWASRHQHQPSTAGQQHPQHVLFQGEPIHVHAHAMAECQGCIAEQNIEHSCSLKHDASLHDDHVMVSASSSPSSSSHRLPHHHHHHQHTSHPHNQQQPASSSPPSSSPSAAPTSHQTRPSPSFSSPDHSRSQNSRGAHRINNSNNNNYRHPEEPSPSQPQDSDSNIFVDQNSPSSGSNKDLHFSTDANDPPDGDNGDSDANSTMQAAPQATSCGPGRNTWPRKRARPAMPHVSTLFTPEVAEHQGSEAKPAGRIGEMYFVSFDDSICNGGDAGTAAVNEVKRRPRNSHGPHPAELTTVKKGTPLYGQPSWWGEEEEEREKEKEKKKLRDVNKPGPSGDGPSGSRHRPNKTDGAGAGGRRSRPNSLTLSGDEADHFPVSGNTISGKSAAAGNNRTEASSVPGQSRMNGERIKPTYMEIPFGDDDNDDVSTSLDTTAGGSGKKTAGAADSSASTPAKSISSSLSKDSLLDSPDARKAPATSFTVDLSDPSDPQHKSTKAVTMTASLSQYVPSKIRRNFKDRQERAGSYTKTGSSSRGSTPSKASEERELSPVHPPSSQQQHVGQRKMEDIWSVVEGSGGKPAKQVARLSSVQATASSKPSSLRSPNLEDIDRISGEDSRLRGQKTSSLSPHVPRSSRSKVSPASSAGGATKSTAAGVVSAVAQYPDSTSYLIDKMFEGGSTSGFGGSTAGSTVSCESEVAPEKQMYKEAAANDRTRRSTSSGGTSGTAGKQSGKPPRIASGKSSAAPALSAGGKRTSSSSEDKPAGQSKSKPASAGTGVKSIRDTAVASSAASTAKSQSKRQPRSSAVVAPSPPKICDNNNDNDSDDDNHGNIVEDDDLQITEEEEQEVVAAKPTQNLLEDGEVSDKASEAGTYVIEAGDDEVDDEEEEEARRKIDEVFGVDKGSDTLRLASPGGYDNVYDEDAFENDETLAEGGDLEGDEGDKTPLEGHSPLSEDEDALEDPTMATKNGVQTWMSQLNALTSSHRQPSLSADDRQMAKEDGESSLSRKPPQGGAKRPGTGRKLPSIPTDRSPVSSEHSSTCILDPESAQVVDGQAGWSAASSQRLLNGGHKTNGSTAVGVVGLKGKSVFDSTASSRNKVVKNGGVSNGNHHSRHVSASSPGSARSRGSVDTELLLQDTETVMAAMEARMAYRTAGHQGSTDSDRRESREDGEFDSDTDVSSTAALVNGDDDYVKPSYYTSPRDALSRSISHNNDSRRSGGGKLAREGGMANTASAAQSGKRAVGRSYSQTVASKSRTPTSSVTSPRTPGSSASALQRRSVGSDIYNGRDSVGADSLASDLGSESGTADGSLSRSSSRGKGTITMTKPNRAFQLRRARSDSVEETAAPTTPRSAKSSARTSGSSARSSSVHSTNRTRSVMDTNRSEATSLGAQIARKSRNNGAVMQTDVRVGAVGAGYQKASSSTALNRQDGGRHSLRLTRASSLTISSPSQSTAGSYPKKDSTHVSSSISNNNSKSHSQSTPTGSRGNLTITGVGTTSSRDAAGSSRCHSQPGSRSNSPKAAERIAWRRRKEYDPRKAVAEAKAAKTKDPGGGGHHTTATVTMRPKPHANSRVNRRMIRSASFTNTGASLALSLAGSVSASQELGPPSASDYGGDSLTSGSSAFRRAFLPFQSVSGRTCGHHSAHSGDEDDSLLGSTRATTAKTYCRSPAGSHLTAVTPEPKSAFTPPPLALHHAHSARRRSPSASGGRSRSSAGFSRTGSLSLLRRRSLQGETDGYLPLSLPRSSADFEDDTLSLTNGVGGHGESSRSRRHLYTPPAQTSYDTLIVSSIHQLSMKLLGNTDKSLQKLRDQSRASQSPSPCDDYLNDGGGGGRGEMTAFRSANQELAGVLNNLRRLERHVQVMNSVLFPEDEVPTRVSAGSLPSPSTPSSAGLTPSSATAPGGGRQGKQRYFAEIERIRSELAGFHPIGGAQVASVPDNASSEADSPEMAELSEQF